MAALVAAAVLASSLSGKAWAGPKDRKYYYEDIYGDFFVPDQAQPDFLRPARPGAMPSSFAARKPAGILRIFLIGGSTTQGYSGRYDLAEALALALPATKVEVINAGMSGYDSFRELLVEKEVLRYEPDVLVFITGHNDFGIKKSRPPPYWVLRADDLLSRWSWWAELHRRFDGKLGPRREPTRDEIMAELRRNAREHARRAAAGGVKAIFVAPPLNYRDNAPEAPMPWESEAFLRGWVPFERRDWAKARAAWLDALAAPPRQDVDEEARSFELFFLARAEEKLGLPAEARGHFEEAVDSERGYYWCARRCRDALQEIARAEGALWADADGAFRREEFPRMPGLGQFNDKVHWREPSNRFVSESIVAAMRSDARLGALPWDGQALERAWSGAAKVKDGRELALHVDHLIQHGTADSINEVNFSLQSVVYFQALEELVPGSTRDPDALYKRARAFYERQLAHPSLWEDKPMLDVSRAAFLWNFGELELERGRYESAAACFKETLEQAPRAKTALLSLAVAEALSGRAKAAAATLSAAIDAGLRHHAETLARALGLPLPGYEDRR